MLRINSLSVEDIGGISKAEIRFHPRMNVICGPNGVGKTTILDIVAHMTTTLNVHRLKKRAGTAKGIALANFQCPESKVNIRFDVSHFQPSGTEHYHNPRIPTSDILYLRNNRLFDWVKLKSISSDPIIQEADYGNRNSDGIPNTDSKNWFVNRYLYSAHNDALTAIQLENFEVAKKVFAILDAKTQFSHVEASSNEVMVITPKGQIPYEYLSSGFKSCITIFWGLIKEIEYSRSKGIDRAADYDGIILIDELELHLHPIWQSKILQSLKSIFPDAQFIVTTHSPHIVQSADSGEVMPLEIFDNGHTHIRDVPELEHGLSMWTVEEILEDIMGMKDTRTEKFTGLMRNLEHAISSSDEALARTIFDKIQGSLHPNSPIRKIVALQIASITGSEG